MGGCCSNKQTDYFEESIGIPEEMEIAKFESELGANKKSFNYIYSKLVVSGDEIKKSVVNKILKEDFSEKLAELVSASDYFHSSESCYNTKKILYLFLLITRSHKEYSGETVYFDRTSFIILEVKRTEESKVRTPVLFTNKQNLDFLETLVEISCVIIVSNFILN